MNSVPNILPPEFTQGATLLGNEYGWSISTFPLALVDAQRLGYACLGGQFEYRYKDGSIYELYWLDANPTERGQTELWNHFVERSCGEVSTLINSLLLSDRFQKDTKQLASMANLFFVAYFVTEEEWKQLSNHVSEMKIEDCSKGIQNDAG